MKVTFLCVKWLPLCILIVSVRCSDCSCIYKSQSLMFSVGSACNFLSFYCVEISVAFSLRHFMPSIQGSFVGIALHLALVLFFSQRNRPGWVRAICLCCSSIHLLEFMCLCQSYTISLFISFAFYVLISLFIHFIIYPCHFFSISLFFLFTISPFSYVFNYFSFKYHWSQYLFVLFSVNGISSIFLYIHISMT